MEENIIIFTCELFVWNVGGGGQGLHRTGPSPALGALLGLQAWFGDAPGLHQTEPCRGTLSHNRLRLLAAFSGGCLGRIR